MKINFIKNLTFKNKLLFFVIIFIFAPMIVFLYIYFMDTTAIIEKNSIQLSQDILNILKYRIDTTFKDVEKQSNALRYNPTINSIMNLAFKNSKNDSYLRDIEFIKQSKMVTDSFRNICLSSNSIQSIGLVTSGQRVHDYNFNPTSFNLATDVDLKNIITTINENQNKPIWYFDEKTKHMLYVRSVNDAVSFQNMGYLILAVNNRTIQTNLKGSNIETLERVDLVTPKGSWISNTDKPLADELMRFRNISISGKEGYHIDKPKNLFMCFTDVQEAGWQLFSYRTYHSVVGDNSKAEKNVLNSIIAVLIISVLFISLLNRDFINPINNLVSSMKRFEKDGEYHEIFVDRQDEMGYLAKTYNSMASNINFLLKRVYIEELTRKEAEIKALQSQINPHFLFNTLQSINMTAQLYHAEPISDCIMALSSLLEASMGRKNALVSLKNELDYIGNYVFIMQQRIANNLIIKKQIGQNLLSKLIPVLILQPIIENSITYATKVANKRIYISIHIYEKDGLIHFELCDNGRGIEPSRLDLLHSMLSKGLDLNLTPDKRKSIGLENVNKRLILLYGESSCLKIESRYGYFTKISFVIPSDGGAINSNHLH